jgi:peptidoglycan/LPS O-acetylase OafA/YrhL
VRYNPALDGLRAVAITLVVLTHSFVHIFPGGWIGVDVFFVLSGYLITSILSHEINNTGHISWGNFYWRRFIRLTPALVMLACFQFVHAAISPHNGHEIVVATLASLAYVQNWNVALQLGPYDVVGHTWSLATEEQFYLLWPVALLFIVRHRPLLFVGAVIVAMMVARIYLWHHGSVFLRIQSGPDARPVGILIGCGLAMIKLPRMPSFGPPVALAALLFMCLLIPNEISPTMILAPMAASLLAAVVIAGAQQGSVGVLAWRPAVYLGKISYGLYLYSLPICILGADKGINPLILIGASVAVAALSYEFVEKPFFRFKDRLERRTAIAIPTGSGLAARS